MTCLLDVELGVEVVTGVGDELLVWSRVLMAVFTGDGALMGFFRGFRAPPGCPGVERQFLEPRL